MCGGGGGSDDGIKYQRAQERKRQEQIAVGKQELEKLFAPLEGNEYTPDALYRTLSEDELRARLAPIFKQAPPTAAAGGFVSELVLPFQKDAWLRQNGDALRALGYTDDQIKSNDLQHYLDLRTSPGTHGMKLSEGTGTPIWDQQVDAYLDYSSPQLDRQYADARGDLAFALARQGQLSGSVAGDRWADLGEDLQLRKQEVADTARNYGNQAKADIAQQKQSLLTMLSATADSGATAEAAKSAVASLRSTPGFQPLGPLFQNATAGLAAGYGGYQQGQTQSRVNQIVYGGDPDRGSGRVVR